MEEEKKLDSVSQQENVENTDVNYIEAIKEMKQNTVSKEAYSKLQAENKQLLSSLINGEQIAAQEEQQQSKPDIQALRNSLYGGNEELNNLEYMEKTLELRDAVIAEGKPDPFLPIGEKIIPTDEDIATADRVAKILKDTVEYADGDSNIFTNELQRIMVDSAPTRRRY